MVAGLLRGQPPFSGAPEVRHYYVLSQGAAVSLPEACRARLQAHLGPGARLTSINRPYAGRGEFEQMPVRVTKVEAPATQIPLLLFFYRNPSLFDPRLPVA